MEKIYTASATSIGGKSPPLIRFFLSKGSISRTKTNVLEEAISFGKSANPSSVALCLRSICESNITVDWILKLSLGIYVRQLC